MGAGTKLVGRVVYGELGYGLYAGSDLKFGSDLVRVVLPLAQHEERLLQSVALELGEQRGWCGFRQQLSAAHQSDLRNIPANSLDCPLFENSV